MDFILNFYAIHRSSCPILCATPSWDHKNKSFWTYSNCVKAYLGTRKSSCVNARGIPPALHNRTGPGGGGGGEGGTPVLGGIPLS